MDQVTPDTLLVVCDVGGVSRCPSLRDWADNDHPPTYQSLRLPLLAWIKGDQLTQRGVGFHSRGGGWPVCCEAQVSVRIGTARLAERCLAVGGSALWAEPITRRDGVDRRQQALHVVTLPARAVTQQEGVHIIRVATATRCADDIVVVKAPAVVLWIADWIAPRTVLHAGWKR